MRLSAPPSLSDSLLAPLVGAFQERHPDVRVQILVTERLVDHIAEGVDLVFRVGAMKDSTLIARKILTYRVSTRRQSGLYQAGELAAKAQDLRDHRLLAFSRWRPENRWTFVHVNGRDRETLTFQPFLSMNDYAGLASTLLAGADIGELPPIVQPELLRSGRLVELIPKWRFRTYDLSVVHPGSRHIPRPVRVFKDFAVQMAPALFPSLPT